MVQSKSFQKQKKVQFNNSPFVVVKYIMCGIRGQMGCPGGGGSQDPEDSLIHSVVGDGRCSL